MAQLRRGYQEFVDREAEIVVVSPEEARLFKYVWDKEAMPFVGIPDPKHIVAELYDQEIKLHKFGRMPALVLIDKQGQIRYRHYADSMSDIPPNAEILAVLDQLNLADGDTVTITPSQLSHTMSV